MRRRFEQASRQPGSMLQQIPHCDRLAICAAPLAEEFTNRIFENTDLAFRHYQALQFQSRYSVSKRWTINGNYTVQLQGDGNVERNEHNRERRQRLASAGRLPR